MNTQSTSHALSFIKFSVLQSFVFLSLTISSSTALCWEFDFSRRREPSSTSDRPEAQAEKNETPEAIESSVVEPVGAPSAALPELNPSNNTFLNRILSESKGLQEIVILNTDKGFMPSQVKLHTHQTYKVHVVNLREKDKNISFVSENFSQFHSTYFGKIKTFSIAPTKEGVFSFQCPETSQEGKWVIVQPVQPQDQDTRLPTSADHSD